MKDKLWWLKEAVVNYLRGHQRVDTPEIVSYMKVPVDLTMAAIRELKEEGKVDRYWNGRYYEVRIIK
jgi:ribosomal protein S25